MPGRITGSRSARSSAYNVEVPDEGDDTSLRTRICQIFGDAQNSTVTQRKLQITLRKVQENCCFEPQDPSKSDEGYDEEDFINEFTRCILRILTVKKGELVGDRVIRFLGLFLKHASEKGERLRNHVSTLS